MTQLIQDIKPRTSDSAYVVVPFDEGKAVLEANNYRVISLEENAGLRIHEGEDAYVSRNGNWVREGILYLPDKRVLLTKNSPIMDNSEEATSCHRNEEDFYLNNYQVEKALEDSVEIKDKEIPTNKFGEDELTVYAFGENAESYGRFLESAEIKEMPIWLTKVQDKPFVRQLWFSELEYMSVLYGLNLVLYNDRGVRGIKHFP